MKTQNMVIALTAVILAVTEEIPRVLVVRRLRHDLATPAQRGAPGSTDDNPQTLPFGPFDPNRHRTLEQGLLEWVEEQTGLDLRYVEQLYTFGNQYRDPRELEGGPRVVSTAYLALTHESPVSGTGEAHWRDWYSFLPWEDWREGPPDSVDRIIRPQLLRWIRQADDRTERRTREERADVCFGIDDAIHDSGRTLERYELLYEVGLVPEAHRDRTMRHPARAAASTPADPALVEAAGYLGQPMAADNRRLLATALGRIRGKLAYRPVVFELLPATFTLLQLQRVVEALAGVRLHKQNFRRMLVSGDLVEPTGHVDKSGPGRPAKLHRFRRDVVRERAAVGISLPSIRTAD